jgi:hypothetical protein
VGPQGPRGFSFRTADSVTGDRLRAGQKWHNFRRFTDSFPARDAEGVSSMRVSRASSAALILVCAMNAGAQSIYKWVDENGVTHYSEQRPQGIDAERTGIRIESNFRGSDSETLTAASENTAAVQAPAQENLEQNEQKNAQAKLESKTRRENCAKAREQQRKYETSRRLYRELENGERQYLDDQELDQARAQARELVNQWCD